MYIYFYILCTFTLVIFIEITFTFFTVSDLYTKITIYYSCSNIIVVLLIIYYRDYWGLFCNREYRE